MKFLGFLACGLLFASHAHACGPYIQASNFPAQGYAFGNAVCASSSNVAVVNFQLSYNNGQLMSSYGGSGANGDCALNFPGGSQGFPSGFTLSGPASEGTPYAVVCYSFDGTLYGAQSMGCEGGYCNPMTLYP